LVFLVWVNGISGLKISSRQLLNNDRNSSIKTEISDIGRLLQVTAGDGSPKMDEVINAGE
jgi:hypothetical protein